MIAKTRLIGMTIGGTNQVFMCISFRAIFGYVTPSFPRLRKALRSDGKLVLSGGAQYASTQERFATSPSVVVRKFMRIAVCLKSIQ
jgi:hypothetical protein